ncbi:c-type cytochrome [Inmirania thermothiophila]|uniref:Cytochrome c553 n=1 Tax=Inmirania thermothiophila TaxID=1750597 RepID=A0A3N1Y654_9GAMM|nr:c-type cytochrome [Inmirania thermothiophila]ROR34283.1 cytochrome c553 [Inmirania thermothiophila]
MWRVASLVLLTMGVVGLTHAAGDPEAGKAKTQLCAGCHGADGNSVNPLWPNLAGQHPKYLEAQLRAFKSGARKDPTMSPMAATVQDGDIPDIAAYFAAQTVKASAVTASEEVLAEGRKIYLGGIAETRTAACAGCHGPRGQGNGPAGFPALAGQKAQYVAKQLKDFRAGTRATDPNGMMRDVAKRMTDAEIAAVAAYIASLR